MLPAFKDRLVHGGIYNRLIPIFTSSKDALSNIDTANDIRTSISKPWGKGGTNRTTHFQRTGTNRDLIVNIFGEVLGRAGGTTIGALGGSNLKTGQVSDFVLTRLHVVYEIQTFDDDTATTVRDVIALDVPTKAPDELNGLYRDQVGTLNEISDMDLGFSVCNPFILTPVPSNIHF